MNPAAAAPITCGQHFEVLDGLRCSLLKQFHEDSSRRHIVDGDVKVNDWPTVYAPGADKGQGWQRRQLVKNVKRK